MSVPLGAQLHYRSSFDLLPAPNGNATWSDIVKAIRSWLTNKTGPDEQLGGRWFFTAGSWKGPNRTNTETESALGNGNEAAPEHWAFRYEHPCNELKKHRRWRTDIGVTAVEPNRFLLNVATVHWLLPGFIGQEPESPIPTAPGIVGTLLRSTRWLARAGSEPLTPFPIPLNEGSGADFVKRLEASDRTCPIVLITLEFATGKPKLDPKQLAKLLTGSAVVYVADTSTVDKELEWLLPRDFRCWNGMVRVYQPGVRLKEAWDKGRHRFFTASDIDELTPRTVEEILVTGISRRSWIPNALAVASIEDVAAK